MEAPDSVTMTADASVNIPDLDATGHSKRGGNPETITFGLMTAGDALGGAFGVRGHPALDLAWPSSVQLERSARTHARHVHSHAHPCRQVHLQGAGIQGQDK